MTRYMSIVPPCDTIRDAQLTRIACSHSLSRDDASPPVEQDACDHEHCRHRQHVCKSFRGRPLGGLFHAVFSLNLGTIYRCAKRTQDRQNLLGTPHSTSIRVLKPLTANIDSVKIE